MRSIDSLREYAANAPDASMSPIAKAIVAGLADSIDREVAEVRDRDYRNGVEDGEMAAERDGWVRLPVDADGEVIHIGEMVDEKLPFGGYAAPAPIDTMELSRGASGYGWMVKLDAENRALVSPKLLRHHHAPTVEDVLREFADAWAEWKDGAAMMNPVETFAAKLRLKEG